MNVVGAGLLQQGELRGQGVVVFAVLALQASLDVEDLLRGHHAHVVHKLLDEVQGVHVAAILLERGEGSVLVRPIIVPDVRQKNIGHHLGVPFAVITTLLQQLSQELVVALVVGCHIDDGLN